MESMCCEQVAAVRVTVTKYLVQQTWLAVNTAQQYSLGNRAMAFPTTDHFRLGDVQSNTNPTLGLLGLPLTDALGGQLMTIWGKKPVK